jgi:hypothetical protein
VGAVTGVAGVGDGRGGWQALRQRWMAEPGATDAYAVIGLVGELGAAVRELRVQRG